MKKIFFVIASSVLLVFQGCHSLDMNPLTEGSTENWFSTEQEFSMAVNEFYRTDYWYWEAWRFCNTDRFTDDWNQRDYMYDWVQGSFTSDFPQVNNCWTSLYKGVTRANTVLLSITKARERGDIPEESLEVFEGEASFFRAVFYSYLVFLWGDVPFYTDYLFLDDAFKMGRTDKTIVLKQIYDDFDLAARNLPVENSGKQQRVTSGAALAFKARIALWMSDWTTAAKAAGDCIDLGVYSLHPDFAELFLNKTRVSPEMIYTIPRSRALMNNGDRSDSRLPRNVTGVGATAQPSWELFCSYLCTDGKPIDESPLYNPTKPFENRDPRCAMTMVEFGTAFLNWIYDPGAPTTRNVITGQVKANMDSRLVETYAAFNGMCLKKGVDEEWVDDDWTDSSLLVMRYADLLLMYAEAKIELNQIDQSVRDAINTVRARAYGVSPTQTTLYPAVTEDAQAALRTILRTERRMELAWENRRWFDLIRWRLAEKVLSRPIYCHDQKAALQAVIDSGDYFFPRGVLPVIDENCTVDLSPLLATGKIIKINERNFSMRQYLMPIPAEDIIINKNLVQNEGY